MEKEIVYTYKYALILSDEEIKEGDYRINIQRNTIHFVDEEPSYFNKRNDVFKKVIAHLPLSDAPILEGVPLLPSFSWSQQDDVQELAEREYREFPHNPKDKTDWHYNRDVHCFKKRKAFIKGYNKAKEKYKFTKVNMLIIRNKLVNILPTGDVSAWYMITSISNYTKWFDEYLQSLQQQRPTHFECEMVDFEVDMGLGEECIEYSQYPKTITNSQGQVELVGKYLNL